MNAGMNGLMNAISQSYASKYDHEAINKLKEKYKDSFKKTEVSAKNQEQQKKIIREMNKGNTELEKSENKRNEELAQAAFMSKDAMGTQRIAIQYEKTNEMIETMSNKGLTGKEKASEVDWSKFSDEEFSDPSLKQFFESIKHAVKYTSSGNGSSETQTVPVTGGKNDNVSMESSVGKNSNTIRGGSNSEQLAKYNEQMKSLADLDDKSIAELTAIYMDRNSQTTRTSGGSDNDPNRTKWAQSLSTEGLGITGIKGFGDLQDKIKAGVEKINNVTYNLMANSEKHKKEAEKLQGSISSIVDLKI